MFIFRESQINWPQEIYFFYQGATLFGHHVSMFSVFHLLPITHHGYTCFLLSKVEAIMS